MRVIVLSNYYPPYYRGGYELNCQATVDELKRRQHQVLVVTSNWQARQAPRVDMVRRVLHIHGFKDPRPISKRARQLYKMVTGFQDYWTTLRLGRAFRPDVAYIWNMGGLSLRPLMALQRLNVPLVFDLGDYWLWQKWTELVLEKNPLKRRYRSALEGGFGFEQLDLRHLLAHSQVLKQEYVKQGFPAQAITVIPRGLPSEYFAQEPAPLDYGREMRLLYVGRLTEVKGVHIAIEAIGHLAREGQLEAVHLDIVGAGEADYVQRLQQRVAALGLERQVCFRGHLSPQDLMASYRQYHALLFPVIWIEPFGKVVIEAMAQGLCVIASNRGGPAEIITHGRDGLLVPAQDPHALAQAIISLTRSPDRTRQMRQAAIETARRYAFDKTADQVEAYLQTVIDQHRST